MMVRLTSSKPRKSAREYAIDCLSRRALSHCELEARLCARGYEGSEIKAVMDKMEKWGYLDDRELALMVAENRLKRYSRRRVLQDLQNRGLESQVIEQVLELTYSRDNELQQCLTLAERWWVQESKRWEQNNQVKKVKKTIPRELWLQQRVAQKLVRRGYPLDMVKNVLYRIQTLIDEHGAADV